MFKLRRYQKKVFISGILWRIQCFWGYCVNDNMYDCNMNAAMATIYVIFADKAVFMLKILLFL